MHLRRAGPATSAPNAQHCTGRWKIQRASSKPALAASFHSMESTSFGIDEVMVHRDGWGVNSCIPGRDCTLLMKFEQADRSDLITSPCRSALYDLN